MATDVATTATWRSLVRGGPRRHRTARSLSGVRVAGGGWQRLLRAAAVLVVLLGVVVTHVLATSHHGVAHAAPPAAVESPAEAAGGIVTVLHSVAGGVAGAALAGDAHLAGTPASCGVDCEPAEPALLVLCVAVMAAAGAWLLLTLVLRRRQGSARSGPSRSPHLPRSLPRRRLNVVAELCISRT
jgi:hypothetical protein